MNNGRTGRERDCVRYLTYQGEHRATCGSFQRVTCVEFDFVHKAFRTSPNRGRGGVGGRQSMGCFDTRGFIGTNDVFLHSFVTKALLCLCQ